jgi:hypothetical protein
MREHWDLSRGLAPSTRALVARICRRTNMVGHQVWMFLASLIISTVMASGQAEGNSKIYLRLSRGSLPLARCLRGISLRW